MLGWIALCCLFVGTWAMPNDTIVSYLNRHHLMFSRMLKESGMVNTLSGQGPFTVFVPYYHSLNAIPGLENDTARLANLMKYHIVNGIYKVSDLWNERMLDSLLPGRQIRINHYYSTYTYTAEGVQTYATANVVSNGVVHLLTGLMSPPLGTIVDVLSENGNFSQLLTAIQIAGWDTFLEDTNPITFFAPTKTAFARLGTNATHAILGNPALLKTILQYHTIPGTLYAAGFNSVSINTFDKADRITLYFNYYMYNILKIDGFRYLPAEISANNGVVHPIDHVLIPASVRDQVKALM